MGEYANRKRQASARPSSSGPVESDGFSLIDMVKSVPGDFGHLVSGLGSLIGSGFHDVGALGANALGKDWDYYSDDIVKQMGYNWEGARPDENIGFLKDLVTNPAKALSNPRLGRAIKDDYSTRYGALAPGGRRAGETLEQLEDDPLSYLLDALDVATFGSSSLVKGAQVASKTPSIGRGLDALSEEAEAGAVARTVDKIAPGLKYQRQGQNVPIGGETRLLNQKTGRVETEAASTNPIRRATVDKAKNLYRTESPRSVQQRLNDLDDAIKYADEGDPIKDSAVRRARLGAALDLSRQKDALILTERASEKAVRNVTIDALGITGTRFVRNRDALINAHKEVNARIPKSEMKSWHRRLVGADETPGIRLPVNEVLQRVAEPGEDLRSIKVAEVMKPHVERLDRLRMDPLTPVEEIGAAERLFEIVGGEALAKADEVGSIIDDTRLINFDQEAEVFLKAGGTYQELFERMYAPLRVKEMAEQGLDNYHQATPATVLDDERRARGIKAPAYFPRYRRPKLSDFVMKFRTSGMGNASKPKSFKTYGGTLDKRYWEGFKDAFITDPDKAYAILASDIVGLEETARFITDIKDRTGRLVSTYDDFDETSEVLINPHAIKVLLGKDKQVKEAVAKGMASGDSMADAFINGITDSFGNVDAELADLLARRGELYAVPKVVAEEMQKLVRYSIGGKKLRLFFDGPMNAWRTTTLYLRGGFYLNNIVGNQTFLGLQGGASSILNSTIRRLDLGYNKMLKEELRKIDADDQVGSGFMSAESQRTSHFGVAQDTKTAELITALRETKPYKAAHKPIDWGQRLNDTFEFHARSESFLTAAERDAARRGYKLVGRRFLRSRKRLQAIMEYGAKNPDSIQRWADEMNEVMNNYRAQSPAVRKITRRFISPFWPFFYHSSKTLFKMPFNHPGKSTVLNWLADVDEEITQDVLGILPDYLESALPIGEGDQPGETRLINPKSANPLGAALEDQFNLLGPIPKMAFELARGEDSFTGGNLTTDDAVTPYGSDQAYDAEGNPVTVRPNDPLEILHYLGDQFPAYTTARNLLPGAGARYDTGETMRNPDGSPKYPTDPVYELLRLAGIPLTDLNLGQWQAQEGQRRAQARSALGGLLAP